MRDQQPVNWRNARLAVLYALSFVLLVIVYRLWENDQVPAAWKLVAIGTTGLYLLRIFDRRELVSFAGFCMLMAGLTYVWSENTIRLVWKNSSFTRCSRPVVYFRKPTFPG